jgi:hypothetical protein
MSGTGSSTNSELAIALHSNPEFEAVDIEVGVKPGQSTGNGSPFTTPSTQLFPVRSKNQMPCVCCSL